MLSLTLPVTDIPVFPPFRHHRRLLELLRLPALPRPQTFTRCLVLTPALLFSLHPFIFPLPSIPLGGGVNCLALNTDVLPRLPASGGEGPTEETI